jgi:hypothetical protein
MKKIPRTAKIGRGRRPIALHAVQFGNNWMKKIPRTAKIGRGRRPSPIWQSEDFFELNYYQIGQACSPVTC